MFKKILLNNFIYLIVIFSFICVEVYFSYLFNVASRGLGDLDKENELASLENQKLLTAVSKYSSLESIEKSATDLGFIKTTDIIYLNSKNNLAQKN